MLRCFLMSSLIFFILPLLVWAQVEKPPGVEIPKDARQGEVPDYFMLTFTDPGCDPGEDCDDVGPKKSYRNWYFGQSGCNWRDIRVSWRHCEKVDPGDGEPVYDFSDITLPSHWDKMKFKVCHIDPGGADWIINPNAGLGPPWVEKDEFKFEIGPDGRKRVSDRYWKRLEHFAEAAARHVREKYGVTIFKTGGNERDLVARSTYEEFYPDWHFYYMAPVVHIRSGMKKAHQDNKLIIGNFCYTTPNHVGAIYQAGAKDKFEIFSIHAYGHPGVHVDMWQIIESHKALAAHGDGHIGIVLDEGWSCFPLPDRIDKDPILRRGAREYTEEDHEHYRQTVLDGWRNLMTPREGEYEPEWVIGARYFVMNDHWGGRNWEKRATAEYDEHGNLRGFHLDGYWMGTSDPNWIKPFLRPWGLIDIEGKPKGDTVLNFPPYLPKHEYKVVIKEPISDMTVAAGHEYSLEVTFTNREDTPMTDFRMEMIGRDDPAKQVRYRFIDGDETTTIEPGQTINRRYTAVYPQHLVDADPYRARGFADAYYTWEGRLYHTDAWMPKVSIAQPITLELGDSQRTAAGPRGQIELNVKVKNTSGVDMTVDLRAVTDDTVVIDPRQASVVVPARGESTVTLKGWLSDIRNAGLYEVKIQAYEGVQPINTSVAFPKEVVDVPRGFGLRNPSFEAVGAESGYAFWEGEKTNWIDNDAAKRLPGAGERAFGAYTEWREFDYTISQTVALTRSSIGKRILLSAWYEGHGWLGGATGRNVIAQMRLVFLDQNGGEVARKDGPEELGTGEWRQITLTSDAVPSGAQWVRVELRLASLEPIGCRRGAIDVVSVRIIP